MLLALNLGACTESNDAYTRVASTRAPLLANFESYLSPAEARARLPPNLVTVVSEESSLKAGDPRPRFDFLVLSVHGYTHLGFRGELVLHFFNDRLMSTWFYPDSYQAYVDALRSSGVNITGDSRSLGRHTEAWTSKDYRRRFYVAWHDRRLSKENERWINRYS